MIQDLLDNADKAGLLSQPNHYREAHPQLGASGHLGILDRRFEVKYAEQILRGPRVRIVLVCVREQPDCVSCRMSPAGFKAELASKGLPSLLVFVQILSQVVNLPVEFFPRHRAIFCPESRSILY